MNQRPSTYRSEIIIPLLRHLDTGDCCSIIGINGMGKTNMLQQLQRPAVRAALLPTLREPLQFVNLDANLLVRYDAWGFFEGLTEALGSVAGAEAAAVYAAHQAILAAEGSGPKALRHCALALADLLAQTRLVIVFDEFDYLFAQLPTPVLRHLRGLRDRYKYRLSYLTFSREPLTELRDADDWDELEPFVELFSLAQFGLGPLTPEDAASEVERFAHRFQASLSKPVQQRIVMLSGGYPALLRALTHSFHERPESQGLPTDQLLHTIPALRGECAKLWNGLSADEQDAIRTLLSHQPLTPTQREQLILKQLVQPQTQATLVFFSPLLATACNQFFGLEHTDPQDAAEAAQPVPLCVDHERRLVSYYGHDISSKLTGLKFRLIAHLANHPGAICEPLELARAVYHDANMEDSNNHHRIITLVKRVRKLMNQAVPHEPNPIQIVKGRGVRLG
ncbi:winged helix-turn-helix domain-containing protein [Candidatus Viridilinea mediisalina]|nr:winged helix-turn-helix domain-containing protein [Candidatus Viridilinea mediisalina]